MSVFIVAKQTTGTEWTRIGDIEAEDVREAIRKAAEEHPDSDRFIAAPSEAVTYDRVASRRSVVELESEVPEPAPDEG